MLHWQLINGEKDKRSYNLRGNIYYDLGEYQKALIDYEKAIEIDSNYLGAIRNKGYTLRQLHDFQGCFYALTTVIEENYIRIRTYYERGDCLFHLKKFEEAEEDLLKVVEADPNHIRALYTLSRIYFNRAEHENALTYVDKVLELERSHIEAIELKSLIFSGMGKYEDSIEAMTEAINLGSDNIIRFFVRGIAYYNLGQFNKAIQEFSKSEEYLSSDGRLYLFWAYSLIELNKNSEGCSVLQKSADLGNQEAIVSISEYCYQL